MINLLQLIRGGYDQETLVKYKVINVNIRYYRQTVKKGCKFLSSSAITPVQSNQPDHNKKQKKHLLHTDAFLEKEPTR